MRLGDVLAVAVGGADDEGGFAEGGGPGPRAGGDAAAGDVAGGAEGAVGGEAALEELRCHFVGVDEPTAVPCGSVLVLLDECRGWVVTCIGPAVGVDDAVGDETPDAAGEHGGKEAPEDSSIRDVNVLQSRNVFFLLRAQLKQ